MNKLTNIHTYAAFAPLRGSRAFAAVAPFHAPSVCNAQAQAAMPRPGLQCSWVSDAAGHLVCSWTEASPPQDRSVIRRGPCRVGAALSVAA